MTVPISAVYYFDNKEAAEGFIAGFAAANLWSIPTKLLSEIFIYDTPIKADEFCDGYWKVKVHTIRDHT